MNLDGFLQLPTQEAAQWVREAGVKVCVLPVNGTRRWFALEYASASSQDDAQQYLESVIQAHIRLYTLFFDHGIDTLLSPVFGPDLMNRGEEYMELAVQGLAALVRHPALGDFYDRSAVRVRFYGDHQTYLARYPVGELFDALTAQTASNDRCRLFYGVCGHDATEAVARIAVRFYQEHGRAPDRHEIVAAYYGEYVDPVDLFVGFGEFTAYDMPLLALGSEALYFTCAPTPYLAEREVRTILYDHVSVRGREPAYDEIESGDWAFLGRFYRLNKGTILGRGTLGPGRIWFPQFSQAILPDDFYDLVPRTE